jgi:dipeptidyl aminopeptidase/acylaminoacyl peptidase
MRFLNAIVVLLLVGLFAQAQEGYQKPPQVIADLLLAPSTPSINISKNAEWMIQTTRDNYISVEELAQPELRIAGLRINPNNFSLSRQNFNHHITIENIKEKKVYEIEGLPKDLLAGGVSWNGSQTKFAFTNNTNNAVDLYVVDIATKKATKVNKTPLNTILGGSFRWLGENTILYTGTIAPAANAPKSNLKPSGPTIQESVGKAAPVRTYQDLIKSPYDEQLFKFYATTQLIINENGTETKLGTPALYSSVNASPNNQYLLLTILKEEFSYLVPANGFSRTIFIWDTKGNVVKKVVELPSTENNPAGFDNVGNYDRGHTWRNDKAASLVYVKPLDGGIYKNKEDFHDEVFQLDAPFNGQPVSLIKTAWRYGGITWHNDEIALLNESFRSKQMSRLSLLNIKNGSTEVLIERSSNDLYGNPGMPVTTQNEYGEPVLKLIEKGKKILLNNATGSSPKGDLPFLATFDLKTKKSDIIWRASEGTFEVITGFIDIDNLVFITRKETQTDVPNYYIKNLKKRIADVKLTDFANPYPALVGVSKEKISYKRADGVSLTGDLYLPKGYNAAKDGPLPVLMWAYPREFNSAADAAQVRGSQYKFTTLSWGSPIYWVTQGYAVLDNAEMPIVAKDANSKPNDNFVDQLKLNAEAAIQHLSKLGVGDPKRVAVGGHSYGAFMTANLLAHTNLFKAGLARSGAYNRTLTPFGFQNEDRTYWQAPELYYNMSPFSFADKIKTPLLMLHGDTDENSGTFPIQSERLFNAIKGTGGVVRLVFFPYEGHGYKAKENILHALYEQHQWLEKYVKNAK